MNNSSLKTQKNKAPKSLILLLSIKNSLNLTLCLMKKTKIKNKSPSCKENYSISKINKTLKTLLLIFALSFSPLNIIKMEIYMILNSKIFTIQMFLLKSFFRFAISFSCQMKILTFNTENSSTKFLVFFSMVKIIHLC